MSPVLPGARGSWAEWQSNRRGHRQKQHVVGLPAAAGVAALVMSYEKNLTASDLRSLLLDTSRSYPKLMVNLPGTESPVLFSSLSRTGTVVDVFEAVKATK